MEVGHGTSRALSDAEIKERVIPEFIKVALDDITQLKADFSRERQRRVEAEEVLAFIQPQYEKVLALMRKVGWKYEDSEDLDQKVAFSVYTCLVMCCEKARAHLDEYKGAPHG